MIKYLGWGGRGRRVIYIIGPSPYRDLLFCMVFKVSMPTLNITKETCKIDAVNYNTSCLD